MLHDEMQQEQVEYQMTRNTFTGDGGDVKASIVINTEELKLKENHMDNTFWDEKEPSCPFDTSRLDSPDQAIEEDQSVERAESLYILENEGTEALHKATEKKFPLLHMTSLKGKEPMFSPEVTKKRSATHASVTPKTFKPKSQSGVFDTLLEQSMPMVQGDKKADVLMNMDELLDRRREELSRRKTMQKEFLR